MSHELSEALLPPHSMKPVSSGLEGRLLRKKGLLRKQGLLRKKGLLRKREMEGERNIGILGVETCDVKGWYRCRRW